MKSKYIGQYAKYTKNNYKIIRQRKCSQNISHIRNIKYKMNCKQ